METNRPISLFPATEPFDEGALEVGDGHRLHFEQCGDPDGVPVVFLHGGPGSGCRPEHRRFFEPGTWRAVLFDQRGCGRRAPRGTLQANTTAHLVTDVDRLRRHLGIERWLVCGGSWGSSLALAYASQHKADCLGLLLRGIFLTGRADLDWFFQESAALLPDAWDEFASVAPKHHRRQLLRYCERQLRGFETAQAETVVRAWMGYEAALTRQSLAPGMPAAAELPRLIDKYRIQSYYLARRCFLGEARVLDCAARCHGLPTAILHGREDLVCRPANAWRLHRTLHGSRLGFVEGAGHDPFDAPMVAASLAALAGFAARGDFAAA